MTLLPCPRFPPAEHSRLGQNTWEASIWLSACVFILAACQMAGSGFKTTLSPSMHALLDPGQSAPHHEQRTAHKADSHEPKDRLCAKCKEQESSQSCPQRLTAIAQATKGAIHPPLERSRRQFQPRGDDDHGVDGVQEADHEFARNEI